MNSLCIFLAVALSTGVKIPDGGVPMNNGRHQYTVRMEKRLENIADEETYLKWKWRTNLADPKTGLDNDALRAGVKKIVAESGWKDGKEDWSRCRFLLDETWDRIFGASARRAAGNGF